MPQENYVILQSTKQHEEGKVVANMLTISSVGTFLIKDRPLRRYIRYIIDN